MMMKDNHVKYGRSSRVMGYMRPTDSWNIGKQSEFNERHFYKENDFKEISEDFIEKLQNKKEMA